MFYYSGRNRPGGRRPDIRGHPGLQRGRQARRHRAGRERDDRRLERVAGGIGERLGSFAHDRARHVCHQSRPRRGRPGLARRRRRSGRRRDRGPQPARPARADHRPGGIDVCF